jgi:ubiquinone/menaquinone biosynthesis C-methylase UbiE
MAYKSLWTFFKFSWTRKLFYKALYEILPRLNGKGDWQFMNYGYSPFEEEALKMKKPEKRRLQKYPMQMYHYLACCSDLKNLNVLEVGSGRGGGANYIAKNFNPKLITGLDFSSAAIKLAKSMFSETNLKYQEGNAMNLNFDSNCFDVVINVESCHAYANQSKFLSEVARVLKPGGKLLLVDFRKNHLWPEFEKSIHNLPFEIKEEDISKNVLNALIDESAEKKKEIDKKIPKFLRKSFYEFAGLEGTELFQHIESGTSKYKRFICTRIED